MRDKSSTDVWRMTESVTFLIGAMAMLWLGICIGFYAAKGGLL